MRADEAQRAALAAVLDEAERLDVGVAVTVGAAWPLQTPNTARGTEHAAQELQYGVRYLTAPETGPVELPRPIDDAENARGARLHAVTAAHVVRPGGAPTFATVRDWHGERVAIGNPEQSTLLDPDTLVT